MDAEHRDEESIFKAALKITSSTERLAYLKKACGKDAKLLDRVEALLKAYDEAGNFLESPPGIDGTLDDSPISESPGTVIGRYKLLERIGEGGMAVVYMAEQQEPIHRKVALKIIKLGMDTKQVIARFEVERQALAMMDHPHIAKVLDAGTTETGRPYFVMELVHGISITEYCDKNNLNNKERLELFMQVCHAVQHAHQKGIIHRDIKPSNVMVTLHDGKPVPMVIDFGIAKATSQRLTEKTLFTRYAHMIGTPEYMSPEQAEMSGLDIDTRTDIYSLGVLLYELLTGSPPFTAEELRSKGYAEMQRMIREKEPTKPSTKLSTLGDDLIEVARHHKTSPELLPKLVRGDLDWIVMKSLEKDRTRRYETVGGFADDIMRHLNHEVVKAVRPSFLYKLHKFLRRNRASVITAAAIVTTIVIGFIVSTIMYFQAEQASKKEAAARIQAVQAGEKEAAARILAQQAESVANQQRQQANANLARAQIDRGIRLLNEGNCLGLLELLEARETADEIPDIRDSAGRLWAIAYDLCSYRLVHMVESSFEHMLAFSPDGKLLVTASDYSAQLWDTTTGQPHGPPLQMEKPISSVMFSPDGKLLVTHSVLGVSRIWDTATNHSVGPVLCNDDNMSKQLLPDQLSNMKWHFLRNAWWSAALSPDGKLLATACLDGTVQLWEINTGQPYGQPLRHGGEVWTVAFSPDGKLLVSGGSNNIVKLWDVATRKPWGPELGHEDRVHRVAFSPNGLRLATITAMSTRLWETDTGQLLKRIQNPSSFLALAFSPDGKLLATGTNKGMVQLWDTMTGRLYGRELNCGPGLWSVVFSPDSRLLATSSKNETLQLWEVASGQPYGQKLYHQGAVRCVVFSPDGGLVTSAGLGGGETTRIWKTFEPLDTEIVQRKSYVDLGAISVDGKVGAIILGNTVLLWDTTKVKPIGKPLQHEDQVSKVAISPDGKLIATSVKNRVHLWESATGQTIREPLKFSTQTKPLAFSPDGGLLVCGLQNWAIPVLEATTGQHFHTFHQRAGAHFATFSPNGKVIAAASHSSDGIVGLWDIVTGQQIGLPLRNQVRVLAMSYNPDGNILATISGDEARTVRLWDVSIGSPYYSLSLPFEAISGVSALESFSTDGTLLVEVLPDDKARVWRLPETPTDLREMQLRTWVALGAECNEQGRVKTIPCRQWQKLRQELWSYDSRKPQANWPNPANGGNLGVKPNSKLTWIPGLDAVAHNIYFGTSPDKLELLGQVKEPVYTDLPDLKRQQWYCWQVDTVKTDGSIVKGNLWSFSTGSMVGWWKFDETEGTNAIDSSSNNHNGTLIGNPQWQPLGGQIDGSLEFNDDGDYVDLGKGSDFDITGQITLTAWIKVRKFDNNSAAIVTKGNNTWTLQRRENLNTLEFACTGVKGGVSEWGNIFGTVDVNDGQWHHAAGVYDGMKLYLYIDGELDNSVKAFGDININYKSVYIGAKSQEGKSYWNSLIDDVRIYSYALSAEEIKALYAGEGPGPNPKPQWVNDIINQEKTTIEPAPEKTFDYYIPLRSDFEQQQAEEAQLERVKNLEIKLQVLAEEIPDNPDYWNMRAGTYQEMQQWEKAAADYSKAIELDPNNLWSWVGRGSAYMQLKQWDMAVADYSTAIELQPDVSGNYVRRADAYLNLDQNEHALSDYKKAIELDPDNSDYWHIRGTAYREMKEWDKALADLNKAIELDPDNPFYWHRRGWIYLGMQQWDKAVADYSRAIELDPVNLDYWHRRGGMYLDMKEWDKAVSDYTVAIELDPNQWLSWRERGFAYMQLEQWNKALFDYSTTIKLKPDSGGNYVRRADAYAHLGQYEHALSDCTKAIELYPDHSHYWNWRGAIYLGMKEWDKTVADYTKAIELDPNQWLYWHERGFAYMQLSQWDKVVSDYSTAIKLQPDSGGNYYRRAIAYTHLGQYEHALSDFYNVSELNPDNSNLAYTYAMLQIHTGDIEGYRNTCSKMYERFGDSEKQADVHWLVWTCVLGPNAVEDLDKIVKLSENLVESDNKNDQYLNALGSILYRAGRFEEAVEKLTRLDNTWEETGQYPTQTSPTYTWYFLAMAHHQLGQDEVKSWFDKAVEHAERELAESPAFDRKITLQLLEAEAESLLSIK